MFCSALNSWELGKGCVVEKIPNPAVTQAGCCAMGKDSRLSASSHCMMESEVSEQFQIICIFAS